MLAVRPELHLEVAVLGVEEEGLHHLVIPQPEVCLAGQTAGRGGVIEVGSLDADDHVPAHTRAKDDLGHGIMIHLAPLWLHKPQLACGSLGLRPMSGRSCKSGYLQQGVKVVTKHRVDVRILPGSSPCMVPVLASNSDDNRHRCGHATDRNIVTPGSLEDYRATAPVLSAGQGDTGHCHSKLGSSHCW